MGRLRKSGRIEGIFEEPAIDLQEVKSGESHLYNEYLIEIVETHDRKGLYAKVYEHVDSGSPCNDAQTALKRTISFLTHSAKADKKQS